MAENLLGNGMGIYQIDLDPCGIVCLVFYFETIMNTCPYCTIHSFTPFGIQDNITLVYTAPALSTVVKETEKTILQHRAHLDTMKEKWIWIIDFAKMEIGHYISLDLTQKLAKILLADHREKLCAIYLINPNFWLRNTIKMAKSVLTSDLEKKIRLIESSGTGSLLELGSLGIKHKWLQCLDEIRI